MHGGDAGPGTGAPREPLAPLRVVGFPRNGLRVRLHEVGSRLVVAGRADPLLVYFVFGTAICVAVVGSILGSPRYGLAGVMLLSILFAPLVIFAALGAIRLRATCTLDRAGQRIMVEDRSYFGSVARSWDLPDLRGVLLLARAPSSWTAGGPTYELYLDLGGEQYLLNVSRSERAMQREAQRIARFVGVPVRAERVPASDSRAQPGPGHAALIGLLFALPVVLSTGLLAFLVRSQPPTTSLALVSLSALVVAQVGALLAYSYDRSRRQRASHGAA